ncbi:MAG: hypothetical protein ACYC9S_06730 [Leptospirales bacterium]
MIFVEGACYKEMITEGDLRVRLETELPHILNPMGLLLYDLVLPGSKGGVLKVFVDHPDKVNLDQLEAVSRRISDLLDVLDPFPGNYRLEVSSPGLDRVLRIPDDLLLHAGKHVKVKTKEPFRNQKVFRGKIEGVIEGDLLLSSPVGKKIVQESVPLEVISEVRAEFWLDLDPGHSS